MTSRSSRDAFKEMKEYEEALFAVRINSDAVFPESAPVIDSGGAPGSYKLGLYDTCQQFNYTSDENEKDQIGYTPRVELKPKCFST